MDFKYLVVEDNPSAAESLILFMEDYPEYKLTSVEKELKPCIRAVLQQNPDLIFLDVDLGDFTGFDFIKELRTHLNELPPIIMTTGNDKHAMKAVNEDVLYFLLKPIDPDDLFLALNKFKTKRASNAKQIAIKHQKGYTFLQMQDILFLESSSNYTIFYTTNLEKVIVSKTMKEYESSLSNEFLRIHKSFIINDNYVKLLNTTKKKIYLQIPQGIEAKDMSFLPYPLQEDNTIEMPIGESYLDIVKNSIIYNKIR